MLECLLKTLIGLVTIQLAEKKEKTGGPQMDLSDDIEILKLPVLMHVQLNKSFSCCILKTKKTDEHNLVLCSIYPFQI